ncbi:MAG: 2-keto-4-pentenoate hydratase [Tagaea sp.]
MRSPRPRPRKSRRKAISSTSPKKRRRIDGGQEKAGRAAREGSRNSGRRLAHGADAARAARILPAEGSRRSLQGPSLARSRTRLRARGLEDRLHERGRARDPEGERSVRGPGVPGALPCERRVAGGRTASDARIGSRIRIVLGKDLRPRKKPYSRAEMLAAVDDLHPAIEIVDSRYTDWLAVSLPELVADMGSNGALIVGPPAKNWRRKDLAKVAVTMKAGGKLVGKGKGADVLGHPLDALAWLADNPPSPEGLKAGEVVTTGTAAGFHRAGPNDKAVATFEGIGKVELAFV